MSDEREEHTRLVRWREALWTPEGRIFLTGVAVAILYFATVGLTSVWSGELFQQLGNVTWTHILGGRAAGISTGLHAGMPPWLVIVANLVIECFIVLLIYPLFVLSYRKLIVIGPLKESMARTQRYAEAQRPRAVRWGIPGLLLFVWFPFWMTGPVVGSIIGFLIGLGPWTTMAVVLTGTGLAIVCWVFVLNQVFVQLRALGPYVPFVFVALILLIAISIHIRQYFGGRANGTLRQPRDQD